MLSFISSSFCVALRQMQSKTLTLLAMNIQDTDQRNGNFYLKNLAGIIFPVSKLLTKINQDSLAFIVLNYFYK